MRIQFWFCTPTWILVLQSDCRTAMTSSASSEKVCDDYARFESANYDEIALTLIMIFIVNASPHVMYKMEYAFHQSETLSVCVKCLGTSILTAMVPSVFHFSTSAKWKWVQIAPDFLSRACKLFPALKTTTCTMS